MRLLVNRRLWFRLLLSGGLIGLLVWRVNIGDALEAVAEANYLYVLPALPVYTLSKLVDAYRWRVMLSRVGSPPVRGLLGTLLIANMANNFVPLRVGDVLRVQVPAQRYNLPRASLTATVFVTESLIDGVAFVVLLLWALAFLDVPAFPINLVWTLMAVVAVGLAVAVSAAHLRLQEGWQDRGWFRRLPGVIREAAAGPLPHFLEGLAVLRDLGLAVRAMALTFVAWLLEALVFWLFGLAFDLDLAFQNYLVIMIAANMIVAMPVAPSNIGPYEVAVAEVAALLGVQRSLGGAYAIGSHLFNILWVGVTGFLSMWLLGLSFRDVFYLRGVPEEEPTPPSR